MDIPDIDMQYHVVAMNPATGRYECITDRPFLFLGDAEAMRDHIDPERDPQIVYSSDGIEKWLAEKNIGTWKFYRTLVRITDVNRDKGVMEFVLPGWSSELKITRPIGDLSEDIQKALEPGLRVHADVNLAAERAFDIELKNWEWDGMTTAEQLESIKGDGLD